MKNQVLSIEQMQELQKLGVDTSKASMGWARIAFDEDNNRPLYDLVAKDSWVGRIDQPLPTFTLQDILELLPFTIIEQSTGVRHRLAIEHDHTGDVGVFYANADNSTMMSPEVFCSKHVLESSYTMLVWCAENGHMKTTTTV